MTFSTCNLNISTSAMVMNCITCDQTKNRINTKSNEYYNSDDVYRAN